MNMENTPWKDLINQIKYDDDSIQVKRKQDIKLDKK